MSENAADLSIGQVSARTGLSVHALRFYEREGLFASPVRRDPAGRRRYTDDDVEWLEMCMNLRATGMPLVEIRRYAELVRHGPGNEPERLAILRRHHVQVTSQIKTLADCRDLIDFKVRLYENQPNEPGICPPR